MSDTLTRPTMAAWGPFNSYNLEWLSGRDRPLCDSCDKREAAYIVGTDGKAEFVVCGTCLP